MPINHISPLDGFRALAILIVFVAHCGLEKLVPGGFGVTIFFFLSGYLITTLLRAEFAQTGRIDIRAFYVRRSVRILPSLYITVLLLLGLTQWLPAEHPAEFWGVFSQLAFLTNYPWITGNAQGVTGPPLWSLAVEEHFYLVFPVIFSATLAALPPRKAAGLCLGACIAVLGIRLATVATISDIGKVYYWTHTRIDSILFGCCLALWQNPVLDKGAWQPRIIHVLFASAILLGCLAIRDELFRQTVRYTLQGGALFVIFSYAIHDRGWVSIALSTRPLRVIALYSYTLYLIHVPIIAGVHALFPALGLLGLIVISGALSMLYAAGMYALVEQPAANWRRRFRSSSRTIPLAT
ncbi:acyltransferase [Sphingomonas sp. CARO-RG-8B-R24-01]|uniref:acyltransferase family protein n=1 Tax=Sphingomonas sp. CARO-RG-8B-R24-01 TaxID=2914831 RepID=UPI001F595B94